MEREEYETQAQEFLSHFGLEIKVAFKGDRCPPWDDYRHIHGDRYRVTIKRARQEYRPSLTKPGFHSLTPQSISFDFWNSQADMQAGNRPSAYQILSVVSSEGSAPTDPDEVVEEYGEMKPSQASALAKFARRLQAFFTEEELEALQEIQ